jgi:1-phosphofructokinase family hexose kinase
VILSAGLTPAWQQILVLDSFQVGEVNRAREAIWCGSGKVLNAGIAAHHLGGPSLTLSTMGGPATEGITTEFQSLGVPHRWVQTHSPTRVCTTIVDRSRASITELVENGRPLTEEELDEFRHVYAEQAAQADVVVLIGSLPLGTPDAFYRQLLEKTSCPAVLDFRGEGLLSVLDLKPEVVKPNRDELSLTLNRSLDNDRELLAGMRSLNERGARWVVVTHGAEPVWVTSPRETYRLSPPPIAEIVNPIASGDAIAATIAWGLRDGRNCVESVRLGLAAAAQNVCQILPCRLNVDRMETESQSIAVEKIDTL